MHWHNVPDNAADSPAFFSGRIDMRRPRRLRRFLKIALISIARFFASKKDKYAEHDVPLGDQVKLPEEYLESLARMPNRPDRKKGRQSGSG